MSLLRLVLYPFSMLYGFVTATRNHMFDRGIKTSFEFDANVIGVGNLTVGGTGKTPMVEYLIRLLNDRKITTLSRGYGRKTRGFRIASEKDDALTIGDEPYQFYRKFPKVSVTVGEQRALAIPHILAELEPDVILMDDSYQHRYVKPNCNILLTDYHRLFYKDHILPAGRLRESREGASRADIIVVTKCPWDLSKQQMGVIRKQIEKYSAAPVCFATIQYEKPVPVNEDSRWCDDVVLFSGLANNISFTQHVSQRYNLLNDFYFPDHHDYSMQDLLAIESGWRQTGGESTCVVTTEKDYVKLLSEDLRSTIEHWPLYYIPIEMKFLDNQETFDQTIINSIKA